MYCTIISYNPNIGKILFKKYLKKYFYKSVSYTIKFKYFLIFTIIFSNFKYKKNIKYKEYLKYDEIFLVELHLEWVLAKWINTQKGILNIKKIFQIQKIISHTKSISYLKIIQIH